MYSYLAHLPRFNDLIIDMLLGRFFEHRQLQYMPLLAYATLRFFRVGIKIFDTWKSSIPKYVIRFGNVLDVAYKQRHVGVGKAYDWVSADAVNYE